MTKEQHPDPDPLVIGMDPRIRIRAKLSNCHGSATLKSEVVGKGWAVRLPAVGGAGGRVEGGEGAAVAQSTRILHL
jgi:hypothetical protein